MNLLLLAPILILGIIGSSVAENDTEIVENCIFCASSEDPKCTLKDFDTTGATTVKCSTLEYGDDINARSVQGVSPKNAYLKRVFNVEKTLANTTRKFKCVKTKLEYQNKTTEVIRTCAPISPTIAKVCDYIEKEMEEGVKVKSCYECDKNYCNNGNNLQISLILGLSAFYFALIKLF